MTVCVDCGNGKLATTTPDPRCLLCACTYFRQMLQFARMEREHPTPEPDPASLPLPVVQRLDAMTQAREVTEVKAARRRFVGGPEDRVAHCTGIPEDYQRLDGTWVRFHGTQQRCYACNEPFYPSTLRRMQSSCSACRKHITSRNAARPHHRRTQETSGGESARISDPTGSDGHGKVSLAAAPLS